jgi:putative ABC transport system permease protein
MHSSELNKIFRDLWLNLPRTLIVILAIATGIFGAGFILDTSALLSREIASNMAATNPSSATLWMDKADARAMSIARTFPGIRDAEATNRAVRGRVKTGPDAWTIMTFMVVDDFNNLRISKFIPEKGVFPPNDGQILIERTTQAFIHANPGDRINVKTLDGNPQELQIAGTVWDPGQDPSWVNEIAYGYITRATLEILGGQRLSPGLRIIVTDRNADRSHVRGIAERLSSKLQLEGYAVSMIEVPKPGKYVQTDRVNSVLYLLEAFGLLCIVLSGLITATLISSLVSQQTRQIGIMKSLGASTNRIMSVYFISIFIFSVFGLIIAVPLGLISARVLTISCLKLLNFNFMKTDVPHWIYMAQIAFGIMVPIIAAAYPIYRGTGISIYEAINDYGVNRKKFGISRFDNFLGRIRFLPRALMLSLRNTFRRRARMIVSLLMLAAGGASFIAASSSAVSWNKTIDGLFSRINYDIDVRFAKPYPAKDIENTIGTIPGVSGVEAWGFLMAASFPKYSDNTYGGAFPVLAPPIDTSMVKPVAIEGRWLKSGDTNTIVVDTEFVDRAAELGTPVRVGDELVLNLVGKDTSWNVVGIVDKIGMQSAAYVDSGYFAETINQPGYAASARIRIAGPGLQKTVASALEKRLAEKGLKVFVIQGLSSTRRLMVNHVILILALLMLMAVLVAGVGALGLAVTMSINVMERTREIGIMRAVGATGGTILRTVITEGIIIGIVSWFSGVIVSIPLTYVITYNAGQFIFPRIMEIVLPVNIPFIWLFVVIAVSGIASFYPAWKASRLAVRDVLSYE